MTHLTNFTFDGARADLSKTLSQFPAFQVSHNFSMGSQGQMGPSPGSYNFGAVYANSKVSLAPHLLALSLTSPLADLPPRDNRQRGKLVWTVQFRLVAQEHHQTRCSSKHTLVLHDATTDTVRQLAPSAASPSMLAVEYDRSGKDYTLNLKSYNPSPADLTGTYLASYLQSVTPHFAVGVETVLQRPTPDVEEAAIGYMAKYHSIKKGEDGQPGKDSWIATGQILAQGVWQATYWQKLADRIDAAADLVIVPAPNPRERKAIATVGIKYDFRASAFRGQVDSTGKVSALLEQRLSPAFAFLIAGEMDHFKVSLSLVTSFAVADFVVTQNTSKFGVGLMIESADPELMQQQQEAAAPVV